MVIYMEAKFTYNYKPKNVQTCEFKTYKMKARSNHKFAFCTRMNRYIENSNCTDICSHKK